MKPKKHIDVKVNTFLKELWKPQRYKVIYGGRGSGKTHAVADYLVAKSLESKHRILCAREIQKSIKESVHEILVKKINSYKLDRYFDVTDNKIRAVTGSEFIFTGLRSNISSVKSLEGVTICWVEEAQTISRISLDVLRPTIREFGSELIFTLNPENENDPVYQDFILNTPTNCWLQKVNFNDNPLLPKELETERLECLERNPDDYKWIWEGELRKISDAQIFKGVYEVKEFETPENTRFYHGADWGYAEDPTVLIRCFIDEGYLYIDEEAHGKHIDLDDLPRLFNNIKTASKWPIRGDDARPDIIKHLQRRGFNIRGSGKWAGSIEAGIAYIRNFNKVIIHPRCANTVEEFERYSYKQDRHSGEILPQVEDKYNHCIDALRYALSKRIKRGLND